MFNKTRGLRGTKIIIATVVGALLFSACAPAKADGQKALRLSVSSDITTLDSLTVSVATSAQIIGNIQEGLTTYAADGKIIGGIAESWTVSPDQLTYNFKLRQSKWENGEDVTAADFVFAWQKVATLPTSAYKTHLKNFVNGVAVAKGEVSPQQLGATAISATELEIKLTQPTPYLLDLLAFPSFLPVKQSFYEQVGADKYGTSQETVLANGPFKLASFAGDSEIKLAKNDLYWDIKNVDLDAISIRVIKQAETQSSLYDAKELDALVLTTNLLDKYKEQKTPILVEQQPRMSYLYLSGNTKVSAPLLENKSFRQAIAHAIDKELITEKVLKDGSVAAEYMMPKGLVEKNKVDFREYSGKYNTPIFNVTKAKAFLEEAKQSLGTSSPFIVDVLINDSETNRKVFESVKAQVEENLPEIKFNINIIPAASFNGILREKATPAANTGWVAGFKDPITFLETFQTGRSLNYSSYSNPKYDELIKATDSVELAEDQTKRWDAFVEAEAVLLEDFIILPLYQQGQQTLIAPYVKGLKLSPTIPSVFYKYIKIEK
ncbi:MAG: peptide ABC transporter substrate-binding protein [Culicoidibacterales bacterium]